MIESPNFRTWVPLASGPDEPPTVSLSVVRVLQGQLKTAESLVRELVSAGIGISKVHGCPDGAYALTCSHNEVGWEYDTAALLAEMYPDADCHNWDCKECYPDV